MEITSTTHESTTVLAINGRIDTTTASDLEREINRQIENNHRKLILNFSRVTYISSGGLRVLLSTAKKLRGEGDAFALCCLSSDVFKVLKLAGFTSLFSIFSTEEDARAGI